MKPCLVDTDVLIEFLRGKPKAESFIKSHFNFIRLSAITVAELYSGVREGNERIELKSFLDHIPILPITYGISVQGGLFKRDFAKSHGTGLADAMIASTALIEGITLCSFNKKHFPMVKDFKVPYQR